MLLHAYSYDYRIYTVFHTAVETVYNNIKGISKNVLLYLVCIFLYMQINIPISAGTTRCWLC